MTSSVTSGRLLFFFSYRGGATLTYALRVDQSRLQSVSIGGEELGDLCADPCEELGVLTDRVRNVSGSTRSQVRA